MGNSCCNKKKKKSLSKIDQSIHSKDNLMDEGNNELKINEGHITMINNYLNNNVETKIINNSSSSIPKKPTNAINVDYKTFIKGKKYSDLLNDYILLGHLGSGAFGYVQKVRHKASNQIRAMKTIKKDSQYSEKSLKEIDNLMKLNHPNILKLYEYYFDNKNLYIITEYCEGGELFDKIKERNGNFTEKDAAKIMKSILLAVTYCHSQGIVHRDLKPENILLEGKDFERLKIIDFGTSIIMNNKGEKFKERLGTAYYIAPEVLKKNYDEKCDLWSIGVIMYILLTGEPPFNGRNDEEILKNVKSMSINFYSYLLNDVSFDAKDLLKKLLQRDTKLRISAASALEHPWIKNQAPNAKMNKNSALRVFNNLKNFSADEKLQEAAIAFIVNQLTTKEEIEELRKIFIDLDKNNDGVLSREEIENGLIKYYGSEQAIEETNKIFNKVDADGNGTISYDEFIRASIDKQKLISEERLKAAYKLFDKNGDGNIEAKEIKEVLGGVGVKDEKIWDNIIKEVDENGDGVISYEEFKKMMYQLCK